ncbi:unnamed protein product, partial [Effrenium voratum]
MWKLALALVAAEAASVSPMEKVVTMLSDLKEEVSKEGASEEANFKKYSDFCGTTSSAKEAAIKLGEDKAAEHTASITQKSSAYEETLAEIKERKATVEKLAAEQQASADQCSKDKASFESAEADLASAVVGLESAVAKVGATQGVSLLQSAPGLQRILALGAAMGFVSQEKTSGLALLQEPWLEEKGAEYNKKDYAFQSAGVLDTLQGLLKQFREERSKGQEEWKKTKEACANFAAARAADLEQTAAAISSAETNAAALKGETADKKQLLLETKSTLKDDKGYLSELTTACEARKKDFEQRSKMRAGEQEALGAAITALKEKAQSPVSFLQLGQRSTARVREVASAARQTAAASQAADLSAPLRRAAAALLAEKAERLGSRRLQGLAQRMERADVDTNPFQVVKDMVQGMVNQLLAEAASQVTQKSFCDAALGKATKERDRRLREAKKLSAKLGSLDTKREELLEETALLTDEVAKLEKDLAAATELRAAESQENLKAIKEAKQGLDATKEAIVALQDFYKGAARKAANHDKAMSFFQKSALNEPAPGFEGSYGGKQTAAEGVISMMEVVRDDFEKAGASTKSSEDSAAEEFTKLKQQPPGFE